LYFYCHKHYIRAGLTAIVVLLAGFLACEDKGFNPALPVDYPVYFVDTERPVIFSYVPATGKLDSMPAPFLVKGLKVTPDGKELYVSDSDSTIIIDIATEQRVLSGPKMNISFSQDGSLYAINGKPIQVLRSSDDSVVFSDTSTVYGVHFSNDNKRIYGITNGSSGSSTSAYMANLQGDPNIRRKTFFGSISEIIPSTIDSIVFVLHSVGWGFEVYSFETDSTIFTHTAVPGWGEIAMTPDGKRVFITAPGQSPQGIDPLPSNTITVFDVGPNMIQADIPTSFSVMTDTSSVIQDFAVGQIAVTADGKWLVGLGSFPIGGVVITIDISTLSIKETVVLGTGRQLFRLTTPMD